MPIQFVRVWRKFTEEEGKDQDGISEMALLGKLFLLFHSFTGHGDKDHGDHIGRLDLSGAFDYLL